jgi:hypothetical protein
MTRITIANSSILLLNINHDCIQYSYVRYCTVMFSFVVAHAPIMLFEVWILFNTRVLRTVHDYGVPVRKPYQVHSQRVISLIPNLDILTVFMFFHSRLSQLLVELL